MNAIFQAILRLKNVGKSYIIKKIATIAPVTGVIFLFCTLCLELYGYYKLHMTLPSHNDIQASKFLYKWLAQHPLLEKAMNETAIRLPDSAGFNPEESFTTIREKKVLIMQETAKGYKYLTIATAGAFLLTGVGVGILAATRMLTT